MKIHHFPVEVLITDNLTWTLHELVCPEHFVKNVNLKNQHPTSLWLPFMWDAIYNKSVFEISLQWSKIYIILNTQHVGHILYVQQLTAVFHFFKYHQSWDPWSKVLLIIMNMQKISWKTWWNLTQGELYEPWQWGCNLFMCQQVCGFSEHCQSTSINHPEALSKVWPIQQ